MAGVFFSQRDLYHWDRPDRLEMQSLFSNAYDSYTDSTTDSARLV